MLRLIEQDASIQQTGLILKVYKFDSQDLDFANERDCHPKKLALDLKASKNEYMKRQFVKIKVKSLVYSGRPVIAVFISDHTKQVHDVISRLIEMELLNSRSQSNAPPNDLTDNIGTHVQNLQQHTSLLQSILSEEKLHTSRVDECLKQFKCETIMMDTLLSNQAVSEQLQNANLQTNEVTFDLQNEITSILDIFQAGASLQNLDLTAEYVPQGLLPPGIATTDHTSLYGNLQQMQ